jgi:hypothetical protein
MRILILSVVLLVSSTLGACGGGGGDASQPSVQKTEAEILQGTYLGVAFTILSDRGDPVSEQTVSNYSGGLALRADGTYVQSLLIDGIEEISLGAWSVEHHVLHITPADGSCAYDATYSVRGDVLVIDAVYPCDGVNRITRTWVRG